MEHKVYLKKYLRITWMTALCLLVMFTVLNIYEARVYTRNMNRKLSGIVEKLLEEYPEISETEIMEVLNQEGEGTDRFARYGIDLERESIVPENERLYPVFLGVNGGFLLLSFVLLLGIFLRYNAKKDSEIQAITEYIEEINRRNYSLHIDDMSEDELSILKNEIGKTTMMLKESAEHSKEDKKKLKASLEDISHQLKTPLTSILVTLDNLIDHPDMPTAKRDAFIRSMKREIANINFLVQAILKLSKFDSDTIMFLRESCSLKDLVEEAVANVEPLCDLKNITIDVEGDAEAKVLCDPRWQLEAVTNIMKNSVDHSKENERLRIRYEENHVYSCITIQDFGEGISPEDMPHIFERFYKGENASPDSIGIGLALAKAIVEEDKGMIHVESDEGGTTFIIKYMKV